MIVTHLACRFFGSLDKRPLAGGDIEWVEQQLLPSEYRLWKRYSFPDRRHTISVARDVERQLGPAASRPVLAAALLHDIGKIDTGLETFERVVATVIGRFVPADHRRWGRLRRYGDHNEVGAQMLEAAGSDPITVAWAREHDLPADRWTLPAAITGPLYAADNR